MSLKMLTESTEFLYIGVTGDVPSVGAEVAYLAAGVPPTPADWNPAIIVDNSSHPLWKDASGSGAKGDYWIARLVGSYGGNDVVLDVGDYQCWLRLTDVQERPVRVAPVAVEILLVPEVPSP